MGMFDKIFEGLSKTRDSVVKEVKGLFGMGLLTEEVLEAVEERLIAADLGVEVAEHIVDAVREKALGRHITQDELLRWMAEATLELLPPDPPPPGPQDAAALPHVILVIGVNGAGKTTTIGKLAAQYKVQGKKVVLAAADTFRAGAIAQLELWAQRADVHLVKHAEGSDSAAVAYDAYAAAKARGADILIIDTAGRLHNKAHLMEELKKLVRVLRKHDPALPHESLLVLDGNTGQNAIPQGKGFNEAVKLDGLIVTKLDGTAKGGALLPLCREFGIPVRWVGVGEKVDDLVPFNREAYVQGLFLGENSLLGGLDT